MTRWHEDNVEVLPPGPGAKPWLPDEPVEVPVLIAGRGYGVENKIGVARVYATAEGALWADITLNEGIDPEKFDHQYGVDGQIVEETIRDGVRKVERVRLNCLAIAAIPAVPK